jgi:hypothetical protein
LNVGGLLYDVRAIACLSASTLDQTRRRGRNPSTMRRPWSRFALGTHGYRVGFALQGIIHATNDMPGLRLGRLWAGTVGRFPPDVGALLYDVRQFMRQEAAVLRVPVSAQPDVLHMGERPRADAFCIRAILLAVMYPHRGEIRVEHRLHVITQRVRQRAAAIRRLDPSVQ